MNSYEKKQQILNNIREQLEHSTPIPYPDIENEGLVLFEKLQPEALLPLFKAQFEALGGVFVELDNYQDLTVVLKKLAAKHQWSEVTCSSKELFHFLVEEHLDFIREPSTQARLATAPACITECEAAVARTGSFIFSSHQNRGRTATILYPNHLVIVRKNQLIQDLKDGFDLMNQKYNKDFPSMINVTTGPSRTADIEKTLVTGIHGPQAIYCLFIHK